jgi:hypothetical protein
MPRRPSKRTYITPGLANRAVFGRGVHVPEPIRPVTRRSSQRSLLDQFITLRTLEYSARSVAWEGQINPATLWYGGALWTVPNDIPEGAFVGYRVELGPTNNGTSDTEFSAKELWGTSSGFGGAVVVGADLPIAQGEWSSGPDVPFVNLPNASAANEWRSAGRDWFTFHYATGTLSDTAPSVVYRSSQTTPLCQMLTQGRTLGVALVFRKPSHAGGIGTAAGTVVPLRVKVELTVASSVSSGQWTD